jgi:acylphosphatase
MAEEKEEVVRRGFRVIGRVQGVGFRYWTQRRAKELGLGGWVRNEADGSVVVHAWGAAAGVAALEESLGRGPVASRVERVEMLEPVASLETAGFEIRRE